MSAATPASPVSSPPHQLQYRVGVLGATGTVGQRFLQLLEGHKQFTVVAVGASSKSAGKAYKEAVNWKLPTDPPQHVIDIKVSLCEPADFKECDLVFSALDSSVAGPVEEKFASADIPVFSNARNHRYDDDVPILIPYVNADHIDIVHHQRKTRGYKKGFIVTNANCSSTGLVVPLRALQDAFGLEKVMVFTMQAISGAGYPGVASLDILDNVVPHIGGEEPKLETEPLKILGKCSGDRIDPAVFAVSAHCNRVAVVDAHTECVSVKLSKPATLEDVKAALKQFTSTADEHKLPSAPPNPIRVLDAPDRPQPRLDRQFMGGYVVSVGRVRKCPLFDIKFTFVSHNTVLGAAGGSILNAELAVAKGLL